MKNRNLDNHDNWKTPAWLYKSLNNEFNFDFDPCPLNHDISKWNGLLIDWGKSNFVNPPYSLKLKEAFIRKGLEESLKGNTVVMLLPVSTSTAIFHDLILPNCEIRFMRKRIRFDGTNSKGLKATAGPMHDSMIVRFKKGFNQYKSQLTLY